MDMECSLGSFVPEIRTLIRDTIEPYHVDTSKIVGFVRDAFVHMWSVRPESRYLDFRLSDMTWPVGGDQSEIMMRFDDRWRLGLVYYAAARCYENDITDSVNLQLADTLFKRADAEFAR